MAGVIVGTVIYLGRGFYKHKKDIFKQNKGYKIKHSRYPIEEY